MINFFKILFLLKIIFIANIASAHNDLPNIGTSALTTLSINQEIELGKTYSRLLNKETPFLNDLVINHYINQLGQKLVKNADADSNTNSFDYKFRVVVSPVLNAFAYFGGNVVLYSKLIHTSDDESELASVMSHEIGHVTQRHLARMMEENNKNKPAAWAALLGSILISLSNPDAGLATLSTSMALIVQNTLIFSQNYEKEADRVGIRTLYNSGFDPYSAVRFMQKLANAEGFSSKQPEILLTHPYADNRIIELRNRANQYPKKIYISSIEYYFTKARLSVLYSHNKKNDEQNTNLLAEFKKLTHPDKEQIVGYLDALINYKNKNYNKAKSIIFPLLKKSPNQIWFLDLMTDISLEQNNPKEAIKYLENAFKNDETNEVIILNLANSYISDKNYQKAASLLRNYTFNNPEDINGLELLLKTYSGLKLRSKEMTVQADIYVFYSRFDDAISLLKNVKKKALFSIHESARIDARIDEIEKLKIQVKKNTL